MLPEKKTRKPRPPRKPPVSLTPAELVALLTLAYNTCPRDWVLILVTYWHGLRASESVKLRECDFDLAASTVLVTRGKGSVGGYQIMNERTAVEWWLANREQFGVKGAAKAGGRKRNNIRPKTLQSTEIVKFLPAEAETSHFPPGIEGAPGAKPAAGSQPLPGPLPSLSVAPASGKQPSEASGQQLVFPISRVAFWQLVHRYALAVGISRRKCKTHMLKHTIAKHLIRSGVPINEVQAWLGWKSLETANWYLMADEDELGDRVGKAIRGMGGFRQVQQGMLFP
jgi:integrase